MFVYICLCVFLLVTCRDSSGVTDDRLRSYPNGKGIEIKEYSLRNRIKRGVVKIADWLIRGAISRVLRGAKQIHSSRFLNQYSKRGGFAQAEKDFKAFAPTRIVHQARAKKIGDVRGKYSVTLFRETGGYVLSIIPRGFKQDGDKMRSIHYID